MEYTKQFCYFRDDIFKTVSTLSSRQQTTHIPELKNIKKFQNLISTHTNYCSIYRLLIFAECVSSV